MEPFNDKGVASDHPSENSAPVTKPEQHQHTESCTFPQEVRGPFTWSTATVETSRSAAKIASKSHSKRCRMVYNIIDRRGDATCEEITAELEAEGDPCLLTTIRSRVCDLRRDGYVIASGRKGVGESGVAPVTAWRLTTEAERQEILNANSVQAQNDAPEKVVADAYREARKLLDTGARPLDLLAEAIMRSIGGQAVAQ